MRTLIFAILLSGCWPEEDVVLFDERFEDGFARWSISGAVNPVETVHPGETGVYFSDWTSMSTAVTATVYDEYSDGLWVEYSATCGGAPQLNLWGSELWLDLPVGDGDRYPDGEFERVHLSVPPIGGSYSITSFTIATSGGLPSPQCLLDNVRIMQPQVDYGY